ncbi:acyl-CoA dehydrogenase family protein [Actinoplanes sp. NPDC048796]|uniref:acyl-CoA dehydrogenase family protein n=1 Tax=unclassified Actinoplanes TaxID=2626549 RepID=UPI0034041558
MPIDELPELLRPAIEKYRDEAEERGRPAGELVTELRERGAFGVLTPRERGGFGVPVAEALDFYARVARIDGPTAWLLWNFNLGFAAGWLPEEATERIWGGGTAPLIANSGSPGLLTPVDGGYQLNGTWKIVSGAHVAEWYLLAGADPTAGAGFDALRLCAVPRSEVSIQDTWDVVGMRASDSNSVTAENVFVPAHMTQALFAPHHATGLPVINLLFPGCAAVLIGMAEAAIDELIALAAVKKGFDGITLAEKDHVAIAVGRSLSQVAAARGLLLATQRDLDRAGAASTELDRAAVRGAIAHVTETARTVLTAMYEAGSSDPLYRTSRLGRIYRDGMAAAQAANLSTTQWTIPGRLALSQPVGWPFI